KTNSQITDSTAKQGGAIYNEGTLTITAGSTISGCSATDSGGAIYNEGTLTIMSGSTIRGSSAVTSGGGIYNDGMLTVSSGSTISDCSAGGGSGGAIKNFGGTVVIDSSTITGNTATEGGAIDQTGVLGSGSLTIKSSTVSNNLAQGDKFLVGSGG